MDSRFTISRQIEIDSAHRIPCHGSKCRNLHGHRYKIVATCSGELFKDSEQQGMVLDFGFLKEEMINHIHNFCDHTLILWQNDPLVPLFIKDTEINMEEINSAIQNQNFFHSEKTISGSIYIIGNIPTAEVLAKHWYDRLFPCIKQRSENKATLANLDVYETPNCVARYPS